jgi:superfamily II DNA or RNA helicase
LKVKRAKITESESASKVVTDEGATERQEIISQFIQHQLQVLVGIKCLDEGIDIPTATRGILMASSTNPREYVQRIGRIIRQDPSKTFAYLYDICVESSGFLSEEDSEIDRKIRAKELNRMQEISQYAINSAEALSNIFALNL